jgi:hypothetical protein
VLFAARRCLLFLLAEANSALDTFPLDVPPRSREYWHVKSEPRRKESVRSSDAACGLHIRRARGRATRGGARSSAKCAQTPKCEVRANSNATTQPSTILKEMPLRLVTSPSSAPCKCFSHGHAVAAAPATITAKRCMAEAMPLSTPGHAAAATGGDGYAPRSATTLARKGADGLGHGRTVSGLKPPLGSLWPTRGDKGTVVRLGKWFSTESEDNRRTSLDSSAFSLLMSDERKQLQQDSEPRAEGSLRQGVRDKLGAFFQTVKNACFLAGPIRQ